MVNVTADNASFDFGSGKNQINNWAVISDNVMGGVTTSKLEYTENTMVLSGNISLANFGGFASVKTAFGQYDLSPFKGVKIRFKSTNQTLLPITAASGFAANKSLIHRKFCGDYDVR